MAHFSIDSAAKPIACATKTNDWEATTYVCVPKTNDSLTETNLYFSATNVFFTSTIVRGTKTINLVSETNDSRTKTNDSETETNDSVTSTIPGQTKHIAWLMFPIVSEASTNDLLASTNAWRPTTIARMSATLVRRGSLITGDARTLTRKAPIIASRRCSLGRASSPTAQLPARLAGTLAPASCRTGTQAGASVECAAQRAKLKFRVSHI